MSNARIIRKNPPNPLDKADKDRFFGKTFENQVFMRLGRMQYAPTISQTRMDIGFTKPILKNLPLTALEKGLGGF